jgi:itaconate CoA-transferase
MYAFSSILAALYRRQRSGEGAAIRVSLFDSLMEWMSPFSLMAAHGPHPQRSGARHTSIVPYGPFLVAGGKAIMLSVQNEREWTRFCDQVLNQPDLARDSRFSCNERRLANRLQLEPQIEATLLKLSLEEAEARLEAARVPYSRANDIADVLNHPQVVERDRLIETQLPCGQSAKLLRMPFNMEGLDETPSEVPAVGQHTDAVLSELGFSDTEIAALRRAGAV